MNFVAKAILGCAAAAAPFMACGAAEPYVPTAAETDSVNAAFAATMAHYLAPDLAKRFPGDAKAVDEFVDGMGHAFDIKNLDAPYYQGVRAGFAFMIDRLEQMGEMGFPVSPEKFLASLRKALADTTSTGFTNREADEYLHSFMNKMYPAPERLTDESQQAFLDSQLAREGVEKLPSGLLFEVITEGEGDTPGMDDRVRLLYTGRLADGTVFDQTERPVDFPLRGLVPGFAEGLSHMKPGGTYRIFIPPSLAYGEEGAAGAIPPNAAIDFEVKLLDVLPRQ